MTAACGRPDLGRARFHYLRQIKSGRCDVVTTTDADRIPGVPSERAQTESVGGGGDGTRRALAHGLHVSRRRPYHLSKRHLLATSLGRERRHMGHGRRGRGCRGDVLRPTETAAQADRSVALTRTQLQMRTDGSGSSVANPRAWRSSSPPHDAVLIWFKAVDQTAERFTQILGQDIQDHGLDRPVSRSNVLTKADDPRVPPSLVDDTDRVRFLSPRTQDLKAPIARTGRFDPHEHGLKHGGGARSVGHSATVRSPTRRGSGRTC